jgi:signal peptidase I
MTSIVFSTTALMGQDQVVELKRPALEAVVIPVKTLSGDSFRRLEKMLSVFGVRYVADDKLRTILVYASPDTLKQDFKVSAARFYKQGEVIARGAIDTGDQVFVDKFSYNFVKPRRGEVFVFRTDAIPLIMPDPETGAPFYIKRLAGLPGDELRIEPPLLYVNGKVAEGAGFARVMSAQNGYRGYAPGRDMLADPERPYGVPPARYFAMGDNSFNSYDSRYWGPVPEENLVGRGFLVYWPFRPHWGLIR